MASITIIGYGELGTALGKLLEQGGSTVRFWDKDPAKVSNQGTLADAVRETDALFLCIPSWAVREALGELKPHLRNDTLVIGLSKGIEEQTLKTMDQILTEALPPNQPWVLLGGPMIAEELMRGASGAGMAASPERPQAERVMTLFARTPLVLEYSPDVRGVALSSVLKNVYAIGAGIADGLSLGWNAKGWYLARAAGEMAAMVELLGGQRETALGTAGLGDLIATGCSAQSRNHQIGAEFARTGTCCLKGEGSVAFPSLRMLLGDRVPSFPLFSALVDVLANGKPAREVFSALLGAAA